MWSKASDVPASAKNFMSSAAASDLGLGDVLKQQVEDDVNEKRKKALQSGAAGQLKSALAPGTAGFQPASSLLFLPPGGA